MKKFIDEMSEYVSWLEIETLLAMWCVMQEEVPQEKIFPEVDECCRKETVVEDLVDGMFVGELKLKIVYAEENEKYNKFRCKDLDGQMVTLMDFNKILDVKRGNMYAIKRLKVKFWNNRPILYTTEETSASLIQDQHEVSQDC